VNAREQAARRDELVRQRERQRLAEHYAKRRAVKAKQLTVKQRQAARLWAEGYTHREIAKQFGVSKYTITDRLTAAQRKLGLEPSGATQRDRRRLRAALYLEESA